MRLRSTVLLLILLAVGLAVAASRFSAQTSSEAEAARFAAHDQTAYRLAPAQMQRAVALGRTRRTLAVVGTVWTLAGLLLILATGLVARIERVVPKLSRNRWAQGFGFVFLLLLAIHLMNLPLAIYGHRVAVSYGLSVQHWSGWLADSAKFFALEWLFGGLLAMLVLWIIRLSPTRWWFWLWIPSALIFVAGVFVTPYVFDPMFNKFEPLAKSNPALVARLEQVVARGGIAIPPERMFLMRASAKSTTLNAYVTGFGASKRVVVWDTTVAKATPDEICFIFAHELGHYALGHVVLGVALTCFALLPLFWLGYHAVRLLLARYGAAWGIESQREWGALVVLLLAISALNTLSDPIANGFSRVIEHNADVYGEEAVHGIVVDPQMTGQQAFQRLGEDSLDDPTPHPVFELWFYTHPSIRYRAAFAEAYDPWVSGQRAAGQKPKYFAK
jgi:Zn-dependent protease with chaperone function